MHSLCHCEKATAVKLHVIKVEARSGIEVCACLIEQLTVGVDLHLFKDGVAFDQFQLELYFIGLKARAAMICTCL